MLMNRPKIVILPCQGVGKILANITRRAAYLVHQRHPDTTALASVPALLAGDAEQRELVAANPVVLIDGCVERCGAHLLHRLSVWPVAKIEVPAVMTETKLGPGQTRQELDDTGKRLAQAVAERVERVLQDQNLLATFKPGKAITLPKAKTHRGCGCVHPPAPSARDTDAPPEFVTVLPCAGIRRTGGRITQRAAYLLVEERFPDKTFLLCTPALAAAVEEDVVMLERYPTVAMNGCSLRCATAIAAYFGVAATVELDLENVCPCFKGDADNPLPDLTAAEADRAVSLADAAGEAVGALLSGKHAWCPGQATLHGMVHRPAEINPLTGYANQGCGYMTRQSDSSDGGSTPCPR
jgi:uncharacterized metal-binding protein